MDFILGVLAFLQITYIPGLLVFSLFRFRTNLLDKILIVFAASLIVNYCVMFLLSALGIYTRITLGLWITAELIAILWLYRKALVTQTKSVLEAGQDGLYEISNLFFPGRGQNNNFCENVYAIKIEQIVYW